jgi:hypothetical protein
MACLLRVVPLSLSEEPRKPDAESIVRAATFSASFSDLQRPHECDDVFLLL